MKSENGFDYNDYGVMLDVGGSFVNRDAGLWMKPPKTVPNYGFFKGERKSIFNCYQAYIGNDRMFGTWVLIRDTHVDIVDRCQFVRSFDANDIEFDKIADGSIDIVGANYQIYLSPLTDSKRTSRYYMGVKLYRNDNPYKNCRIIFGLGINPNGIDDAAISRYGFTESELLEIEGWSNS